MIIIMQESTSSPPLHCFKQTCSNYWVVCVCADSRLITAKGIFNLWMDSAAACRTQCRLPRRAQKNIITAPCFALGQRKKTVIKLCCGATPSSRCGFFFFNKLFCLMKQLVLRRRLLRCKIALETQMKINASVEIIFRLLNLMLGRICRIIGPSITWVFTSPAVHGAITWLIVKSRGFHAAINHSLSPSHLH